MMRPELLSPDEVAKRTSRFFSEFLLLLFESLRDFFTRGGPLRAAALTFTTLLSLIPLLGLVVVIFRQVGGFEWLMIQLTPLLENYLSPAGSQGISEFLVSRVEEMSIGRLGVVGVTFLLFGTWSLIATVETDLNGIWGVTHSRSFVQRLGRTWLLMTLLPVMAGLSVFLSGQTLLINLLDSLPAWLNEATGHLFPLLLQGVAFFLLYWTLPNTRVRFLPAALGAAFTAITWELAKWGFTAWAVQVSSYSLVYGSLAFLPLFMIWLLLSWVLILIGAELSFLIQNRHTLLRGRAWHREGPLPDYLLALVMLRFCASAFEKGKFLSTGQLAKSLDLPEAELNRVASTLVEAEMLRYDQSACLLLARPSQAIMPAAVVSLFLKSPEDFSSQGRSQELISILEELSGLHAAMLQELNFFPLVPSDSDMGLE